MSTTAITTNFVVSGAPDIPEVSSKIGYKNLFYGYGGSVSASTAAAGFEVENAYDYKQYGWWKADSSGEEWIKVSFSSAMKADYLCIFGHNLHDVGGSVKAQYSTNGTTWTDATSYTAPADGSTIFQAFDGIWASHWRVTTNTTLGPAIMAGVMIGEAMTFERGLKAGFSPSSLSPKVESKVLMSELGVNLASSIIRTGIKGNISLTNLSPDWVRDNWVPMIDHLNNGLPCVFSWDYVGHPDEAVLIWKTSDIPAPTYASKKFMSANLDFEGVP